MSTRLTLRFASAHDQPAIVRLVRSERLNPHALHWPNFIVAECGGRLVGAVQMRLHGDGSRELGSLVVDPAYRRQGIGGRLIGGLLNVQAKASAVHVITARTRARYFAAWGFHTIAPCRAPRAVRRNHRRGQFAGGLMSLLHGRLPQRLVVLERC
jgi:N-acetylglutamate synthase-like GNAT family acetyltransferase